METYCALMVKVQVATYFVVTATPKAIYNVIYTVLVMHQKKPTMPSCICVQFTLPKAVG